MWGNIQVTSEISDLYIFIHQYALISYDDGYFVFWCFFFLY